MPESKIPWNVFSESLTQTHTHTPQNSQKKQTFRNKSSRDFCWTSMWTGSQTEPVRKSTSWMMTRTNCHTNTWTHAKEPYEASRQTKGFIILALSPYCSKYVAHFFFHFLHCCFALSWFAVRFHSLNNCIVWQRKADDWNDVKCKVLSQHKRASDTEQIANELNEMKSVYA